MQQQLKRSRRGADGSAPLQTGFAHPPCPIREGRSAGTALAISCTAGMNEFRTVARLKAPRRWVAVGALRVCEVVFVAVRRTASNPERRSVQRASMKLCHYCSHAGVRRLNLRKRGLAITAGWRILVA